MTSLLQEPWPWYVAGSLIGLMQWPMLKGMYYRAVDVAPPPTSIELAHRAGLGAARGAAHGRGRAGTSVATGAAPCIVMKHDVWPGRGVASAVSQSFVPLLIDIDRDSTVADQYRVSGIPTVPVLDANGHVIRRGRFLNASGMKQFLEANGSRSAGGK